MSAAVISLSGQGKGVRGVTLKGRLSNLRKTFFAKYNEFLVVR